jgi:hypothetical protein
MTIIQRKDSTTTTSSDTIPAANPLSGSGTQTENLQTNAIRQTQMRRYQELKQKEKTLRAQAAARKANLERTQTVREHVQVGRGYSTRTSQKTYAELGAQAEGEKAPDQDIIAGFEKAFEMQPKGQSRADPQQTGIHLHQYENWIYQEEVRKYNEDISFDRAARTAHALNMMPAPDPNRYNPISEQKKTTSHRQNVIASY